MNDDVLVVACPGMMQIQITISIFYALYCIYGLVIVINKR